MVFGPISYREDVTGYYDRDKERYVEIKNGFRGADGDSDQSESR